MAELDAKRRSWARRIVMPLIVLLVAAALLFWGREREERHVEEVEQAVASLVHELAASPVTEPVMGPVAQRMNVSRGTLNHLHRELEAQPPGLPGLDITVEPGDADPPYGDGTATHRAFIAVQGAVRIALRVHHPGDPLRIEILGYWRP